MQESCTYKGNVQNSFSVKIGKIPNCPYMRLGCRRYDSVLKRAICQGHGNQYSESVRCCWLPSWVKDGFHVAVLSGGHLRV